MPALDDAGDGRRLALVIATSTYSDPTLQKLRAPGRDAAEFADVLSDRNLGGFEVLPLVDQTSDKVQRKIAEFCAEGGPSDLALIYFSCHGVVDDRGRLYYATTNTERRWLSVTAISAQWLNDHLEDCRCRSQLLILDCCHSGAFAKGAKGDAALALQDRFEARGRVVLTASRATEYSFEGDRVLGEGTTSWFTGALIDGIRSGQADSDKDGRITVNELYDFSYAHVKQREARQTPGLWMDAAEGKLLVARSPLGAIIEAAPLPEHIQLAIESPSRNVRQAAVEDIARLLTGPNAGVAVTARATLQQIAEEDAPRVAAAARAALEEQARREAEEQARREAEEQARREAEEQARREAEEQARREAEEQARRETEEQARRETEEQARRETEEHARRETEEQARRETEEHARRETEEHARRETEEQARRETEEQARRETEEQARREAEEQARREAEEQARRETEEQVMGSFATGSSGRSTGEQPRREAEEQARRETEEQARRETEEQVMGGFATGSSGRSTGEQPRRETEEQVMGSFATKLDDDLIVLTEHPIAGAREGAVKELAALLRSSDPGFVLAARQTLERMVDDDSQRVSAQAKAALSPPSEEKPSPRNQGGRSAESREKRQRKIPLESVTNRTREQPEGPRQSTADDLPADLGEAKPRVVEVLEVEHAKRITGVALSANGRCLATASEDGTGRVWEVPTGLEVAHVEHQDCVTDVALSPGGQYLATGSFDKTAGLWRLPGGVDGRQMQHRGWVTCVAFSPDGRYLATGSQDEARVWVVARREKWFKRRVKHGGVTCVAFSPDGRDLATGSADHTAQVHELARLARTKQFGHEGCVTDLAFSPDGRHLATGSDDQTARIWNLQSGHEVLQLAHTGSVTSVAFSPDGRHIATGSDDRTVRISEVSSGSELLTLEHEGSVTGIAFSVDGRYFSSGSDDKTAKVWEL